LKNISFGISGAIFLQKLATDRTEAQKNPVFISVFFCAICGKKKSLSASNSLLENMKGLKAAN
jgi:hypothetical protein